jgi:hypothetical protein
MSQPNRTQQRIISLLIQEQLARVAQARVDFAVFVDIWGDCPRAGFVVQIEDTALADIDE